MAEIRVTRLDQGQTKVRNVPIAVTPEGFWCCPSPVVFQKTLKTQNPLNKPKPSPSAPKASSQKKQTPLTEKKPTSNPSRPGIVSNEQINPVSDTPIVIAPVVTERMPRPKVENLPRKVSIEFGEPRTSDLKVVLHGKQGFAVRLSVHKNILVENSSFFADKLSEQQYSGLPCLEIDDCEDVEIYVETVGLMYCKDLKQRLIKQNVSRVLRILKVAEQLGFNLCIQSCLEYLEATPWVGDEEEEKVVSSVLRLQGEGIGVNPVLKRVSSNTSNPPKDTISHILELVLNSNEERGRREMKSVVLKLLRENSYKLHVAEFADKPMDSREPVVKQIALDADNLSWLLEILADRQAADEFAVTWASQEELALLHTNLPIVSRHHVSFITARLFIGIGRGELLPSKDTRHLLLQTWLEPLINDYGWLQHGRRSFDRKLVEEGIGRTILTLPLEDQQRILLGWLGSFLKAGDNCPNLQSAFEVWWRRTFIRPYVEQGNLSTNVSEGST
ncbi:hypothetical protein TEA_019759 [Camellia sinensis var. sinensis]|uniref:At3g05675-like ankyrin-like domain-containing protein n=1 Tax=Camellia sinensis var. sinensis TaxID=542762 RepID=A0A4S4ER22_CAMSN|nr:hypothetical protein TEA_019759 [Camellia sinensis var. sinensis]